MRVPVAECGSGHSGPARHAEGASGRDSLSVVLFEASDRIGGRLWSHRFPETPSLVADMGGVGFSPLHANVYGLCTKELNLKTEAADEFKVASTYNIFVRIATLSATTSRTLGGTATILRLCRSS